MMTPSENVCSRVISDIKSPARAGSCMGLPLGRLNRPIRPSGPSKQPAAQRVISVGKTHVDQPSEEREKRMLTRPVPQSAYPKEQNCSDIHSRKTKIVMYYKIRGRNRPNVCVMKRSFCNKPQIFL